MMKQSMETILFYSWQSDDKKTRSYVEKFLKAAVSNLAENPDIELSPRIDKDTQGTAGAVHIVDVIKKKIKACDIFLADVSLVDTANSGRSIVNQNVIFELGYAMGVHIDEHIILAFNEDLGDPKNLPFDISHHRVLSFSPSKDPKGVQFTAALEATISVHLEALEKEKRINEVDSHRERLIDAIENGKPTRTLSKKYFKELYGEYVGLSPGRYDGKEESEKYLKRTYDSYAETKSISLDLYDLLNVAGEYKADDVFIWAYKTLEDVSQYYDHMPGDSNPLYKASSEYFGLVVYEVVAIIFGIIARDQLWAALAEIGNTKLNRPAEYGGPGRKLDELYVWPEHTLEYFKRLSGANYYIPSSPLIERRFKDNEDTLQAYIDGSLLRLFIADDYCWVFPLLMGHEWERRAPTFLKEFKNRTFISTIRVMAGYNDHKEFRDYLWQQITKTNPYTSYNRSLEHVFSFYGITKKDDLYTGGSQIISV